MNKIHESWMNLALIEARKAFRNKEIPVGAIIVKDNQIIGKGYNQVELLNDATAHAEMIAITAASNTLNNWRLNDCDIYVTLEPCAMCAGAIIKSRLRIMSSGIASSGLQYAKQVSAFGVPGSAIKILIDKSGSFLS